MSTKIHLPRPDPGRNPFVKVELPYKVKTALTDLNYYIYAGEINGVPNVFRLVQASLIFAASAVVANRTLRSFHYSFISKDTGNYISCAVSGTNIAASQTGILLVNGNQYYLAAGADIGAYNVSEGFAAENILIGAQNDDISDFDDFYVNNPQTDDAAYGVAIYEYLNYKLGINQQA